MGAMPNASMCLFLSDEESEEWSERRGIEQCQGEKEVVRVPRFPAWFFHMFVPLWLHVRVRVEQSPTSGKCQTMVLLI